MPCYRWRVQAVWSGVLYSVCYKWWQFPIRRLWQLLEPFDAAEVVEHISRALKHHEVNWKCLLSLTAVTLVTCRDASQHVQSITTLLAFPSPFSLVFCCATGFWHLTSSWHLLFFFVCTWRFKVLNCLVCLILPCTCVFYAFVMTVVIRIICCTLNHFNRRNFFMSECCMFGRICVQFHIIVSYYQ